MPVSNIVRSLILTLVFFITWGTIASYFGFPPPATAVSAMTKCDEILALQADLVGMILNGLVDMQAALDAGQTENAYYIAGQIEGWRNELNNLPACIM